MYNYICQNTNKITKIYSPLCQTYSPTAVDFQISGLTYIKQVINPRHKRRNDNQLQSL